MLKLLKQKKYFPTLTAVAVFCFFVLLVKPVQAGLIENTALTVFGVIIGLCVAILGQLLLVVISVLVSVAQFNNFIGSTQYFAPVTVGWLLVRDICNMFFVLILLVIAFATILHIPGYGIKQLLKRVIIFAILINFSKLICGLIIDFFQVIMLTFVNAFKDIGGGNIAMLLGVDKLLQISAKDFSETIGFWEVIGSYILALLYVIIMLVVMVALLGTLVYRIVMLWIYIILSPLAYLSSVVPFMSGISKSWWRQFFQQAATGPLLAFFIWLSLATLGQFSKNTNDQWSQSVGFTSPATEDSLKFKNPRAGVTEVGTTAHMLRFVISIGLLIGGLIVSKSFGGSAGGAAASAMGAITAGAGWMKRKGKRAAVGTAKFAGRQAWRGTKAAGRLGVDLAKTVDYSASRGMAKLAGREYTHDQGGLTRLGTWGKENVFSKEGWKRNMQKATRAVGWETNSLINKQRSAATVAGYHDWQGVRYKKQTDGRFKSDNGVYWADPAGRHIKAMSVSGNKFHEIRHTRASVMESDSAAEAKDKTDLEAMTKPFKDMSKERLWDLLRGTADSKKLKGIAMTLAGEGNIENEEMFNKLHSVFAKSQNGNHMKAFLEATQKKQANLAFDVSDPDQKAALSMLIKKGKIKLSDQNLAGLDLDKPKPLGANATNEERAKHARDSAKYERDIDSLAAMLNVFRDNLHKERWSSEINKIDKDGDPKVAQKMSDALGHLSIKREELRMRALAAEDYESLRLAALDPDQRNDAASKRDFHLAEAAKLEERFGGKHEDIKNLEGDIQYLRADSLTLDLNSDFKKAFTDMNNGFDQASAGKFANRASGRQLSQISADKLDEESLQTLAGNVTFDRLRTLERSGVNPELARLIAETKARQYDPESEKIVNLYNDIDVDLSKARANSLISELLKEAGKPGVGNLTLNQHREAYEGSLSEDQLRKINEKDRKDIKQEIRNYLRSQNII